jgi:hypothetical protein
MGEFFVHYLKGAPAPSWMTQGERFVDKDKRPPLHITVEKKPARPAPVATDSVRPKASNP